VRARIGCALRPLRPRDAAMRARAEVLRRAEPRTRARGGAHLVALCVSTERDRARLPRAPKSLSHSSKFGSCNRSQTHPEGAQANKPRNEHTHLRHRADRMRSSKHARDRMLWKNFSFAFVHARAAAPRVSRGAKSSRQPSSRSSNSQKGDRGSLYAQKFARLHLPEAHPNLPGHK
jgi:hypothetical protein